MVVGKPIPMSTWLLWTILPFGSTSEYELSGFPLQRGEPRPPPWSMPARPNSPPPSSRPTPPPLRSGSTAEVYRDPARCGRALRRGVCSKSTHFGGMNSGNPSRICTIHSVERHGKRVRRSRPDTDGPAAPQARITSRRTVLLRMPAPKLDQERPRGLRMTHETYENYENYGRDGFRAELDEFARYARQIMAVQERNRRTSGAQCPARGFHAKSVLGVRNATLHVHGDLPEDLQHDCFRPGAALAATVRLSNSAGMHQADGVKDLRGVALRLAAPAGEHTHDLLLTNFERSPAANAAEFMAIARAVAGRRSSAAKLLSLLLRLPLRVGVRATIRIIRH